MAYFLPLSYWQTYNGNIRSTGFIKKTKCPKGCLSFVSNNENRATMIVCGSFLSTVCHSKRHNVQYLPNMKGHKTWLQKTTEFRHWLTLLHFERYFVVHNIFYNVNILLFCRHSVFQLNTNMRSEKYDAKYLKRNIHYRGGQRVPCSVLYCYSLFESLIQFHT